MKKILIPIIACCIFAACGQKPQSGETKNSINIPQDFVAYLESQFKDSIPGLCYDESIEEVLTAVRNLQSYHEGKRKYYPQEEIVSVLNSLQHNYAFAYLHSDDTYIDESLLLFRTILELAVKTTPDINLLSNTCSQDHRIGVLMFSDLFSHCPYYALIYDVTGNHNYDIHWITDVYQHSELTHVRLLSKDETRARYLLTAEIGLDNIYDVSQAIWIVDFYKPTGELQTYPTYVKEGDPERWFYVDEFETIYYNPTEHTWSYCNTTNGVLQKIPETPTLRLHLQEHGGYLTIE